ncbi:MAG: IS630 family transposase [Acidobacteriota bacterium]
MSKEVSIDIIKRIVKEAGAIWKRVRKSLKSKRDEEEFAQCKWELEDLQEQADDGLIDLRYFDIAGISLDPVIPYAWHLGKVTIEIEAAKSKRLNILGFMNTDNELVSNIFDGSINSHLVIECFNIVCETITKKTDVVLDNAPIHTSDEFQEYIEEWQKKGLYVKFLPDYSPELNLIEILWRKLKYEWLPFSAYQSIKALENALCYILANVGSKYQISFT